MDNDEAHDQTPNDDTEPAVEAEQQEPAAQHVNKFDELQDPDGELSDAMLPDAASLNSFQPPRFN